MDALDQKLIDVFAGKVLRKDLLHRIKKGTNVPTFVLEFLLARYCASEEPAEIRAGLDAVLATLQDNYVRPDESNAAQSKVATRGKHRFIDKIHVNYVEDEKRHWAALDNFNSKRVSIAEKFYRDNDRLLEGGIWAEVTVGYNEIEDDDYTFYVEDLRPIQLSHFDFEGYMQGRKAFTRDEWLDAILRSVGLEPSKLNTRLKFHFIARLAALVEPNFNFIELGPRGTGKSYFFSEFTPYSTLLSGGQATKAVLFYNNVRMRVGLVGFWDTVAFDEVAGINIKDADTAQIMKDFMANGRFSRGVEVIADASFAFNGNIDYSIDQLVNSTEHDLFITLPKQFDLAIMDRFACYLPGWEMPKTGSEYLTDKYGFITDYLAEAFHHQFAHTNRYEEVNKRIHLGQNAEGRDEKGIKKTVCAFLKILHPDGPPSDAEFEEYVAYAVEARRRVKEQMNKRKPDDEFAGINLSYFNADGKEVVVYCPESQNAIATQQPSRRSMKKSLVEEPTTQPEKKKETKVDTSKPQENIVEVDKLIQMGENASVEFKSTLRWNIHANFIDKDLEHDVLKTMVAFLNTEGGTLLVGVKDDGSILGIELDQFPNDDKYLLHLGNLINDKIGKQFIGQIKYGVKLVGDKKIIRVDCKPSTAPVFLKNKDQDEFYVRNGPSSVQLSTSEVLEYSRKHFR
jgi:ATP-dependent Lon protease